MLEKQRLDHYRSSTRERSEQQFLKFVTKTTDTSKTVTKRLKALSTDFNLKIDEKNDKP